MSEKMLRAAPSAAVAAILLMASAAWAGINIPTVPVGDVGNAADTRVMSDDGTTGYGRVDYAYNIGKYEVTGGQYTAFLNAVAGVDTYGLSFGSGITRSGGGTLSTPYTYSVATDFVNRPVNSVSFWDSLRFANWLQNGQPTGAQGVGTTETGAYTLTSAGITGNTITRNPGTTWAVTSEDEWYKAAYYKGGGTNAGYWRYPTRSNTAPGQDMADVSGNNANYGSGGTTIAGEFQNSASPYGTFDQSGNVWEWNDTIVRSSTRGLRGGARSFGTYTLPADYRNNWVGNYPAIEHGDIGFRVSQVPEPGSIALLALGFTGMLARRRGVGR